MVSDRFIQRAKRCISSVGTPSPSSTTATGLPRYGVSVKTSTWRNGLAIERVCHPDRPNVTPGEPGPLLDPPGRRRAAGRGDHDGTSRRSSCRRCGSASAASCPRSSTWSAGNASSTPTSSTPISALMEARIDGDVLVARFSDGHAEAYRLDVLAQALHEDHDGCPAPIAWRAGAGRAALARLAMTWSTTARLLAAIEDLLVHGVIVVHGTPTDEGTVLAVAGRFGLRPRDQLRAVVRRPLRARLQRPRLPRRRARPAHRQPVPGAGARHPAAALPGERDRGRPVDPGRRHRGHGSAGARTTPRRSRCSPPSPSASGSGMRTPTWSLVAQWSPSTTEVA